jgi:Ca-activated chloride channel family protein
MVLITDGEDTCNANPCDVARQIAAEGIDLTIDTLGLIPDAKTRNQLSCIAEATGGTYTTVQHRQQLTTKVKQLVDRSTDTAVTPTATQGAGSCTDAPVLKQGLYSDRETFSENRWYRVQVAPGQELRAAVTVSDDRAVNADYGVLLRGVTLHGREIVRDDESGTGRTDAVSAGIRYPKPDSDDAPAETVCLQVGNSFSAPASVKTEPGLPVELSLDLVPAPHKPSDVAFHGLGRGWWLLGLLAVTGIVAGLLTGWAARWRLTSGRTR